MRACPQVHLLWENVRSHENSTGSWKAATVLCSSRRTPGEGILRTQYRPWGIGFLLCSHDSYLGCNVDLLIVNKSLSWNETKRLACEARIFKAALNSINLPSDSYLLVPQNACFGPFFGAGLQHFGARTGT